MSNQNIQTIDDCRHLESLNTYTALLEKRINSLLVLVIQYSITNAKNSYFNENLDTP
ncbi:hypothetical protein [Rodentibacter ratti]|uniref:hypothetical protein n=1 Tax=Rodentibacter ratti TaxID=1906745 RepID=UPI0015C3F6A1|nr:hypothetical protein [Rodentibacter ratti]